MPTPPPALYAENVLEEAIVTAPAGIVERLVDRDIGLECQDTGTTGTRTWHFDRGVGASTPTVKALILAGTAMAGETFTLESSPNNADWTPRPPVTGTLTQVDDTPAYFALTAFAVPRYVRLTVTTPDLPVRFSEIFLSPEIALARRPDASPMAEPMIPNVTTVESASGRAWGVEHSDARWSTTYLMAYSPNVDRVTVLALLQTIASGAKPFWLLALTGPATSEIRWVRMSGAVGFRVSDRSLAHWDVPLQFVEELP